MSLRKSRFCEHIGSTDYYKCGRTTFENLAASSLKCIDKSRMVSKYIDNGCSLLIVVCVVDAVEGRFVW